MKEKFLDGTVIPDWFYDYSIPSLESLGKRYIITDYNIKADGLLYTNQFQELIDKVHSNGGGVIVIPKGVYKTGALYFKQGVNLYLDKDAVLMGSDSIFDYQIVETRIEGETCLYYNALINVENVDGFTILGEGTIDGNGLNSWKAFWKRREWNPSCTNKDEQRPRLIYISNCKNVNFCGVRLINSHFWTTHLYKSQYVKYINCYIYSPASPVKAPSTDAIDIDACTDILVKGCYLEVNDDAVALKGGKGPWACDDSNNGKNERIIIEDCHYGFCHACLTCGSESIHNNNIIMRRVKVDEGMNLLWLKMRPDTPQEYENILIEDISGKINNFLNINPWTQFFDLKGRKDILLSYAHNIKLSNCDCVCDKYFNVLPEPKQYKLSNFSFENIKIKATDISFDEKSIDNFKIQNVELLSSIRNN